MRRIGLIALFITSIAFQARGENIPYWSYEWPCSGYQYGNAVVIYEEQFPNAHPGLNTITEIQLNTQFISKKRKRVATADMVLILVNRRGNRPEGYIRTLLHSVHAVDTHTGSLLHIPTKIKLIEGDVVKVGITCTPQGKMPKRQDSLRYSVDFFGKENSDEE